MFMSEQKRSEARALAASLDMLTREPKRFSPSAPLIIPAMMIFVTLFAIICVIIKLFLNYINSKNNKGKTFALSEANSPDLPTTPTQDQASIATTATMRTRGSLRINSKKPRDSKRNRPPTVSLYQIKQKQSPGSTSTKSKAAFRAISKASRNEANRSLSRDSNRQTDGSDDNINTNNDGDNSSNNISQHSEDITDEIRNVASNQPSSGIMYASAVKNQDETDGIIGSNSNQPEVHIVTIRDLDDNLQHPQPTWPQTESEI